MKSHISYSLAVLCFLCWGQSILGQVKTDSLEGGLWLTVSGHNGFVVPEYSSFTLLTNEPVRSGELSLEKRLGGKNPWNAIYNYPTVGLTLFYTTLGNDEIHGNELALFPFIRLPIFRSPRLGAGISLGLGLGYVTKTYDEETNPFNVVVGSNLNAHFQAKVDLRYRFSDRMGVQTGLALGHFSNANTAEPNIGINNGTVYLGLSYLLNPKKTARQNEPFDIARKLFYETAIAPGFKSTRALRNSRHFTFSATGDVWKPISRIIAIGAGPDIFYDGSAETELSIDDGKQYRPAMQWSTGIHASVSIRYDRLRLILQAGLYMGLPNEVEDELIYNRAMVRYTVSEKFIAYFAMKSHLHILDHPEFGFGYRWGK